MKTKILLLLLKRFESIEKRLGMLEEKRNKK